MNRVKLIRQTMNMSQTEFAKKIGVSQQTLSALENESRPLSDRNIISLCSVFNVNENWLRTGDGEMFPAPPDEDAELMEIMAQLTSDSSSPEQKRFVIAAARVSMNMSAIALKGGTALFEELYNSLDSKKDED